MRISNENQAAFLAWRPGWWLVMPVDGRGQRVAAPRCEAVCVVTLAHQVHGTVVW